MLLSLQKECVELPVQMGIELTNKLMAVPQTDSVKGIIVNKGKATGKVVIASMLDNMEEVTKIYSKMEGYNSGSVSSSCGRWLFCFFYIKYLFSCLF